MLDKIDAQSSEIDKVNLPEVEELLSWKGDIYDNPISVTLRNQLTNKGGFVYNGDIFRICASNSIPGNFASLLQVLEDAGGNLSTSYFMQECTLTPEGDIDSLTAAILYDDDDVPHILKIDV